MYVESHDEQGIEMSRMLYARRPDAKLIAVVDGRSDVERKKQDEIVAGIHRSVLAIPKDDESVRQRQAALATYRGHNDTTGNQRRTREALGGLSAESKKTLTTVLLYAPHLAQLITQGEWVRASAVLVELAPTTPCPERTRELAVALDLLEDFAMEDRHEVAENDVKALVSA